MAERIGKYTLKFGSRPGIIASAAIVGSKEGDGPLGGSFDEIITDGTFGEKTWEKAESAFQHRAVVKAIEKSGMTAADIDMLMAGDLLSQCSGSAFGARDLGIPFVGLYGACSTMALSLALAALSVDSGAARIAARQLRRISARRRSSSAHRSNTAVSVLRLPSGRRRQQGAP